ncbi:MAG: glycosyltransferase [Bacteroidota bacterium]|nr:glycosyltransferase [Bacteroidota bacterium]
MMTFLYFFSACVLLLYAVFLLLPAFYFVFSVFSNDEKFSPEIFISIILPVRNEEKNIAVCLESLDGLNYPKEKYEIILVDDHSTDRTKNIAQQFSKLIHNLKIVDNLPQAAGKKSAITLGIEAAKGEYIATTDGDCSVPENWLLNIALEFEKRDAVFVAGPVAYKKQFSILRDMLQIEQLVLQIVSAGAMKMGFPLMCSGANLAYKKQFFKDSGGYEQDKFVSGDDMMLLLKTRHLPKENIRFISKKSSIVRTNSAAGFTEAIHQRSRWISKFSAYSSGLTGMLGMLVFLANFLLPFLAVISLCDSSIFPVLLSALTAKMLIDLLLLSLAVPFFREPRLLLLAPSGEVFYSLLALVSTFARLSGSFSWKGRKW